jgi:hypothetical protein
LQLHGHLAIANKVGSQQDRLTARKLSKGWSPRRDFFRGAHNCVLDVVTSCTFVKKSPLIKEKINMQTIKYVNCRKNQKSDANSV